METNLLLKKRIDKHHTFSEMAKNLGVSESQLLAIQSGKKIGCAAFYQKLNEQYNTQEESTLVI